MSYLLFLDPDDIDAIPVHVYPEHGREHVADGECWCSPEVDVNDDAEMVFIHREDN